MACVRLDHFLSGLVPLLSSLLLGAAGCATPPATLGTVGSLASVTQSDRIPSSDELIIRPAELEQAIRDRRSQVEEFRFLQEYGSKYGFKIYAAGGTAVGYGSYVRQHLENEKLKRQGKSPKYFESRFEYDYWDIYRSTQDADIVIDLGPNSTPEEHEKAALALEAVLREKFGHLQGEKSVWEVRFLRLDRGQWGEPSHKDALLGWNFQNQHTDSYSTGLIELTKPLPGESAIRDVKLWDGDKNPFLEDLAEESIRFYLEPSHPRTLRAAKGMNPEILSVIRFYTKAFQYGAKIRPLEEAKTLPLIRGFDPDQAPIESYIAKQIRNNSLKLYLHAVDVWRASQKLEQVGLKEKLIRYGKRIDAPNAKAHERLSVWLAREPLPSLPLGSGKRLTAADTYAGYRPSFKTASELGITVVAHETEHFLAYESITRAASGYPNVFQSIDAQTGQAATYGDGWYTKIGYKGAKNTGFTVRSQVHPQAVEGIDFFLQSDLNFAIFRNRTPLTIIEKSLSISPLDYVRLIFSPDGIDKTELGFLEKLSRKVESKINRLDKTDLSQIREELHKNIKRMNSTSVDIWFKLPVSKYFSEFTEELITEGSVDEYFAIHILSQPQWSDRPDWVEKLIKRGAVDKQIARYVLSQAHWANHPELVKELIRRGTVDNQIIGHILVEGHWSHHPELVEELLKRGTADGMIAAYIFSTRHWSNHPEWVEELLKRGTADVQIATSLSKRHWSNRPEWVKEILKRGRADIQIASNVLSMAYWRDHPVLRAVARGNTPTVENLRAGIENGDFDRELKKYRTLQRKLDCNALLNALN